MNEAESTEEIVTNSEEKSLISALDIAEIGRAHV